MELLPGTFVWAQVQNVKYLKAGKIVSIAGQEASVQLNNDGAVTVPLSQLKVMHTASVESVPDMTALADLHEGSLLYNLKQRYVQSSIYTYVGSILVAVNPYKQLKLYEPHHIQQYRGVPLGELPPHIFAIADNAYHGMLKDECNQCMIISGESGAGKTESTKIILQYLAVLSGKHSQIEEQILASSPILESFGNACTVRNNNSSRFGKFIEIQFDGQGQIQGALINEYLLEKSRIVNQATKERNYHVFYSLLAGAPDKQIQEFKLTRQPEKYSYLNKGGMYKVEGVNDKRDYDTLVVAFENLGFDAQTIADIFKIVAIILNLGNVTFELQPDDTTKVTNVAVITDAASLMQVTVNDLQEALTYRVQVTRGETFKTPLNVNQSYDSRDALSKALYSNLFSWLVRAVNERIKQENQKLSIGILDIFGFEDFMINSFEQMCINYANEKLQQFFNQHIFKLEQEDYKKEGINWNDIAYVDNQPCLDMISKKPLGIFSLLDEETNFPKSTDKTFVEKVRTKFEGTPYFDKDKKSDSTFIICHYAGKVTYTADGFLDKNRDLLRADIEKVVVASEFQFMSAMLTKGAIAEQNKKDMTLKRSGTQIGNSGAAPKTKTASAKFDESLQMLVYLLNTCRPHFIRCIKPNMIKKPEIFDDDMILEQLRYSGLLETVRIRQAGYPVRRTFGDFLKRYQFIKKQASKGLNDDRGIIMTYLSGLPQEYKSSWALGVTRIFYREGLEVGLEKQRMAQREKFAIVLQKYYRGHQARKLYWSQRKISSFVSKNWRRYKAQKIYQKQRNSLLLIQKCMRMYAAKRQLRVLKQSLVIVQTVLRTQLAKAYFMWVMSLADQRRQTYTQSAVMMTMTGDVTDDVTRMSFSGLNPLLQAQLVVNCKESVLLYLENLKVPSDDSFDQMFTPLFQLPEYTIPRSYRPWFENEQQQQQYDISKYYAAYCAHAEESFSASILTEAVVTKKSQYVIDNASNFSFSIQVVMSQQDQVSKLHAVSYLVHNCVTSAEVRDEILVQVVKQLTDNPDAEKTALGWRLLILLLTFVGPSTTLQKYLYNFVDSAPGTLAPYLQYLVQKSSVNGSRGSVTVQEILFTFENKTKTCVVNLPDGKQASLFVDNLSTSEEVQYLALEKMDVLIDYGWCMSPRTKGFLYEAQPHWFASSSDLYPVELQLIKETIDPDEPLREIPVVYAVYAAALKQLKTYHLPISQKPLTEIVQVMSLIKGQQDVQVLLKDLLSQSTLDLCAQHAIQLKPVARKDSPAVLKKNFIMATSFVFGLYGKRFEVEVSADVWSSLQVPEDQRFATSQICVDRNGLQLMSQDSSQIAYTFKLVDFFGVQGNSLVMLSDDKQEVQIQCSEAEAVDAYVKKLIKSLMATTVWTLAVSAVKKQADTSMLWYEVGDIVQITERKKNDINWASGINMSVSPPCQGWFELQTVKLLVQEPADFKVRNVEPEPAQQLSPEPVPRVTSPVENLDHLSTSPVNKSETSLDAALSTNNLKQSAAIVNVPVTSTNSVNEQILEWAMFNFRLEIARKSALGTVRGTLKKMAGEKDPTKNSVDSIAQRLRFSKNPLPRSLLKLNGDEEKVAYECQLAVMKYMGDYPLRDQNPVEVLLKLLTACMKGSVMVRTEVFLHCMRQLNGNTNDQSVKRGWQLISHLASYFPPEKQFGLLVSKWFRQQAQVDNGSNRNIIGVAEKALQTTMRSGVRLYVPALEEVTFLELGRPLSVQIKFPDGSTKRTVITPCTQAAEMLFTMLSKLSINKFTSQFGVYFNDGQTWRLGLQEQYVMDLLGPQTQMLSLRRVIWDYGKYNEMNDMDLALSFGQIVEAVQFGLSPIDYNAWVTITTLKAIIGNIEASNRYSLEMFMQSFIPPAVYASVSTQKWADDVFDNIQGFNQMSPDGKMSVKEVHKIGLKQSEKFQLYGCHLYVIMNPKAGDLQLPDTARLSVGPKSVSLLDNVTLQPLSGCVWQYASISGFSASQDRFNLNVGGIQVGAMSNQNFSCRTIPGVGAEMCYILNSYLSNSMMNKK